MNAMCKYLVRQLMHAVLLVFVFSSAHAELVQYTFQGLIDDLSDKGGGIDYADYGFSSGDILYGVFSIDDGQTDTDSSSDTGKYINGTIYTQFWVTTSGGTTIYEEPLGNSVCTDCEIKIENKSKDKLELKDKSSGVRNGISYNGNTIAFDKLEVKFEANSGQNPITSTTPLEDRIMSISDWGKKAEFELKFKDGGDEVKLKGDITQVSAIPVPAAVWLMASALGLLFYRARST